MRALYLWHIVENMGGVYLTTEECTEPSGYVYRSSEEDFYTQIIADLKEAVAKLPVSTSDYGRATKVRQKRFWHAFICIIKIMRKR